MQNTEKIKIDYNGLNKLHRNNTNVIAILSMMLSLIMMFAEGVQAVHDNINFGWLRYFAFVVGLLIINYLSRKRKIEYMSDSYYQVFLLSTCVGIFGMELMLHFASYLGFNLKAKSLLLLPSILLILVSSLSYKMYWKHDLKLKVEDKSIDLENMVLYMEHCTATVWEDDGSISTRNIRSHIHPRQSRA